MYLGIDLGGTAIKAGIVDSSGTIIARLQEPTPIGVLYSDFLTTLTVLIDRQLVEANYTWNEIDAIGIGVPAFIDYKKNIILHMTNVGFMNIELQKDLEKLWKKRVVVDNDANVAALGEAWIGSGKGSGDILCVTVGTGIGAGIISKGQIYHGAMGLAGEIGHLAIPNSKKRNCNCGKVGCLETEASARAIGLRATELAKYEADGLLSQELENKGTISPRFVITNAVQGDHQCRQILAEVGIILGRSLAQVATIVNPEIIVIGGGVVYAQEWILHPIQKAFYEHATPLIAMNTTIKLAALGNDAGILGAVKLAIQCENCSKTNDMKERA